MRTVLNVCSIIYQIVNYVFRNVLLKKNHLSLQELLWAINDIMNIKCLKWNQAHDKYAISVIINIFIIISMVLNFEWTTVHTNWGLIMLED